jgi:hypothetical protein
MLYKGKTYNKNNKKGIKQIVTQLPRNDRLNHGQHKKIKGYLYVLVKN